MGVHDDVPRPPSVCAGRERVSGTVDPTAVDEQEAWVDLFESVAVVAPLPARLLPSGDAFSLRWDTGRDLPVVVRGHAGSCGERARRRAARRTRSVRSNDTDGRGATGSNRATVSRVTSGAHVDAAVAYATKLTQGVSQGCPRPRCEASADASVSSQSGCVSGRCPVVDASNDPVEQLGALSGVPAASPGISPAPRWHGRGATGSHRATVSRVTSDAHVDAAVAYAIKLTQGVSQGCHDRVTTRLRTRR